MGEIAGLRRTFVKAAMDAPFLTREKEHELAVRWKDDARRGRAAPARRAHMRLVIALAARFRHYGLPMADLIQEGHVGLLEAGARFEPDREVRFSTYATWWIRASIQDYILRNWSIVRGGTSSAQKALFFNLRRLRARLSQRPAADASSTMYPRRSPRRRRVARRRRADGRAPVGLRHVAQCARWRRRQSAARPSGWTSSSRRLRCPTRPSARRSTPSGG